MTTEPKLLTEAELDAAFDGVGLPQWQRTLLARLVRERGLIAPEPVDPLLVEAREICAGLEGPNKGYQYTSGERDNYPTMLVALAALRRGREIGLAERPELTRERVRDSVIAARPIYLSDKDFDEDENTVDRIHAETFLTKFHAALTDGEVGNG